MASIPRRLAEALKLLADLGMPRQQQNERSALCLLALLNLGPRKAWKDAQSPLLGITPIMDWSRESYKRDYAPNTRETFRRQTMHQFAAAGIALYNPDKPDRPVNSPGAVYGIEPALLEVLRSHGSDDYRRRLTAWLATRPTLAQRYARERDMQRVPVRIGGGQEIRLSAGEHSELIRKIIEQFAARFVPGGRLVYVGDTGDKWGYFDDALLTRIGVTVDNHGKMPDVVIHFPEKNWLVLVEAVISHGPVDAKRHEELARLFSGSSAGLVFVSAFPDRRVLNKYLGTISWETEAWVADAPSHLIHFNGSRFLGPY
ncbi:MAG: BsuBI/PstI family type II restriction endonuclease [Sulfurisoma sp.]|nr:BsuBI/PstI family type II restriction endonuclease [Sulfurisoma sp.]